MTNPKKAGELLDLVLGDLMGWINVQAARLDVVEERLANLEATSGGRRRRRDRSKRSTDASDVGQVLAGFRKTLSQGYAILKQAEAAQSDRPERAAGDHTPSTKSRDNISDQKGDAVPENEVRT